MSIRAFIYFLNSPFISQGPSAGCDKRAIHEHRTNLTGEQRKGLYFYFYIFIFFACLVPEFFVTEPSGAAEAAERPLERVLARFPLMEAVTRFTRSGVFDVDRKERAALCLLAEGWRS